MKSFIGKQVMVIHGRMKSLRGTLRSLARDTCQVDLFQGQRQQLPRSHVVRSVLYLLVSFITHGQTVKQGNLLTEVDCQPHS